MKKVIVSILAVAGSAAAANAQGLVDLQVSLDGVNFHNSVDANPGQIVVVRTSVNYSGGVAPNLGLASFVYQPTVSNWDAAGASDTLLPFLNGGVQGGSIPGSMVSPADAGGTDGPWGRIDPWGRTATSSTSFIRGHVHTGGSGGAPAGSWLRIAQNQVTSWIGGAGNTTGGSGVPISQLNQAANPGGYVSALEGVVVFQFAIQLSADTDLRTLTVDAPNGGFGNRNATTGVREMYWFATQIESTGSIRGGVTVDGALINVVPSPASLALLGLGGLVAVGRRRR